MKKILNSTSNLIVILLCCIVITTYFCVMSFINIDSASNNDSVNISTETLSSQNTTLSEDDIKLNEEYLSLIDELEKAEQEANNYISNTKQIENFIVNQYGKAMETDYDTYETYSDKQNAMRNIMAPLFSPEAFRQTLYYDLTNSEEEYTKKVMVNGSEEAVTFKNKIVYKRNIFRAFYKNVKSNSAEVLLEIYNNNTEQKEYEKIKVEKSGENNYKITEYKIIHQY